MSAPASHKLHTQQGKNRFKKETDQLPLVDLTPEEKAQIELWRRIQYFPTMPAATRALIEAIGWTEGGKDILDPCAGRLHMVAPLEDYGHKVLASDIHDHGMVYLIGDFLTDLWADHSFDAVFMNPPFGHEDDRTGRPTIADRFIVKALTLAPDLFVFGRLAFLTPGIRAELMRDHLEAMYVFHDRVPMALGRIAKKGAATDYVWFHFKRDADPLTDPVIKFITKGTLKRLTRRGDDRA